MRLLIQKPTFYAAWMPLLCLSIQSFAQTATKNTPWKENQVILPATFAAEMQAGRADSVLIINAGSVDNIKGAVRVGPLTNKKNEAHLMQVLKGVPKDQSIVIYCGCCPMEHCPNIRPAFHFLQKKGFTNFKILDIGESLSADWISKGYPMEEDPEKK